MFSLRCIIDCGIQWAKSYGSPRKGGSRSTYYLLREIALILAKALKIRYAVMNCYLVDIHYWLKEAFGVDRIWNFDIKSTDGTTIFDNYGKGGEFWIDQWVKLREKDWLVQGMEPWPLGMGVQRANHYTISSDVRNIWILNVKYRCFCKKNTK